MNSYLMKMKPVNTFFFGQESKYRKRTGQKFEEADYYQVSAYFPQQTTVLGMLRYLVLQENGQIPIHDKGTAKELIGNTGFQITDENLDFKSIQSLSPVYIALGNDFYLPAPFDLYLEEKEEKSKDDKILHEVKPLAYEKKQVKNNFIANGQMLYFDDYDEKRGIQDFLIKADDKGRFMFYEEKKNAEAAFVFVALEKVGIRIGEKDKINNKNVKIKEKAFYKQIVYTFKQAQTAFAAFVEFADSFTPPAKTLVPMGAEKSLFEITFEKTDTAFDNIVTIEDHNRPKLVLLSDAYCEPDTNGFLFSISKSKPFRFLQSVVDNINDYGKFSIERNNATDRITRSKRFNLYQRGSVFFFDDENAMMAFAGKLKNGNQANNFYQTGYNHFKTI